MRSGQSQVPRTLLITGLNYGSNLFPFLRGKFDRKPWGILQLLCYQGILWNSAVLLNWFRL